MITLRQVNINDAKNLLKWKNEQDTRNNSIVSTQPITLVNHMEWLKKTLADPNISFYIIDINGEPAGDVRLNYSDNETEISIRMDKKYRGMGLATQVIGMFHGHLIAKIVAHNIPSMRVFIANGYRPAKFLTEPVPHYIFEK